MYQGLSRNSNQIYNQFKPVQKMVYSGLNRFGWLIIYIAPFQLKGIAWAFLIARYLLDKTESPTPFGLLNTWWNWKNISFTLKRDSDGATKRISSSNSSLILIGHPIMGTLWCCWLYCVGDRAASQSTLKIPVTNLPIEIRNY